jgi:hypothetical protein
MNGFTGHSKLQALNNAIADFYSLQITTTQPFPACCVFTSRSLVTVSNSGDSSASRAQVVLSQPPL